MYQIAHPVAPWDISQMASAEKKEAAEQRARGMYRRLMALKRPPELSNNEWTRKAGVSTSFFTNMQGGSKAASEPSVGNLRAVLEVVGSSLPEFFVSEAQGRLVAPPSKQALAEALQAALPDLPRPLGTRASYLAEAVQQLLVLPEDPFASPATEDAPAADDREEGAPPRATTRRA